MSLMFHDGGLATVIGNTKRSLNSEKWREDNNLRKWQRRVRVSDATERNLAIALSELSKLAAALSLPSNILDTAAVIYRRAIKKKIIRGRSITNIVAASLYVACRQCGVPRSLDEIASLSMTNKKEVGRSFRFMVRQLDIFVPPSANPTYASRFSNRLAISGKAEQIAIRILEKAQQMKLTSGRAPAGIAAASTYIATVLTNERKTQREIAEIANVTEVTIRNRYKELLEKLTVVVPL
jgi:transcription initiation factor TFIIB